MLSSGLTEEQKLVKNLVSEFARKETEPLASRFDRDCAFPGEIVSKLFDLGFTGYFVPERYGGSGLGCFFPERTRIGFRHDEHNRRRGEKRRPLH